jgi:hypothetical protein
MSYRLTERSIICRHIVVAGKQKWPKQASSKHARRAVGRRAPTDPFRDHDPCTSSHAPVVYCSHSDCDARRLPVVCCACQRHVVAGAKLASMHHPPLASLGLETRLYRSRATCTCMLWHTLVHGGPPVRTHASIGLQSSDGHCSSLGRKKSSSNGHFTLHTSHLDSIMETSACCTITWGQKIVASY